MPDSIKNSINSIRSALGYFFMSLIGMDSTRIQIIWVSAFAWMLANVWFGALVPLVRELSIIYYRQNEIHASPVNLDSVYASSILSMTQLAFMSAAIGYVASEWKNYQNKSSDSITNKSIDNKEDPEIN